MDAALTITVRSPGGRAMGEIVRHADGRVTSRVMVEEGRDDVERMAARLVAPRPPRPRPSCSPAGGPGV